MIDPIIQILCPKVEGTFVSASPFDRSVGDVSVVIITLRKILDSTLFCLDFGLHTLVGLHF